MTLLLDELTLADMQTMSKQQESEGRPTVTVRMDAELIRMARVVCAGRTAKLVDYLDSLTRRLIVADYQAFMGGNAEAPEPRKPKKRGRKAKTDEDAGE